MYLTYNQGVYPVSYNVVIFHALPGLGKTILYKRENRKAKVMNRAGDPPGTRTRTISDHSNTYFDSDSIGTFFDAHSASNILAAVVVASVLEGKHPCLLTNRYSDDLVRSIMDHPDIIKFGGVRILHLIAVPDSAVGYIK